MEPIIYKLPIVDNIIELNKNNIYYDTNPSPKLIKYGLNNVAEPLDMVALTSIEYYKAGLEFNFDRTDKESIKTQASKILGTKNFDQTFAEFWEIILMFGIFNSSQNIYTSHPDTVQDIISVYKSFQKTKSNFTVSDKKTKGKSTLVLYKYSDTDIDENAAIQIIINELPNLLAVQSKGATMVLQLFGLQTQTMAEIISYLSSLYNEAYLMKPVVVLSLFDTRYIILVGLRDEIKLSFPSYPSDNYLISIGVRPLIDLETTIQCMNANIIPKKYKKYYQIKFYLDTKVYEGATYQEMLQSQNDNTTKWLATFTEFDKIPEIMDNVLKKSEKTCIRYSELNNLLGK